MGVTAQSYSKPKGSKAKRAAAEAEAEQRAFDYSTLLDVEPEPQPVIDLEAGRQRVAQKRSQRPSGPSEKLARYFGRLGTSEGVTAPAGVNSIGAMAKAFAEWQREGVTRAEIRAMIDHYWSETYRTNRSSRLPAWQDFLAARAVLQDEGVRHQTESVRNRHQDDASFWSIPK